MEPEELLEIRDALRERIEEAGLRGTAREAGISATALRAIVDGASRPYRQTWERLLEWHVANQDSPPPPHRREVRRMLLSMTRHLPPERRHPLIERMESLLWSATRSEEPD